MREKPFKYIYPDISPEIQTYSTCLHLLIQTNSMRNDIDEMKLKLPRNIAKCGFSRKWLTYHTIYPRFILFDWYFRFWFKSYGQIGSQFYSFCSLERCEFHFKSLYGMAIKNMFTECYTLVCINKSPIYFNRYEAQHLLHRITFYSDLKWTESENSFSFWVECYFVFQRNLPIVLYCVLLLLTICNISIVNNVKCACKQRWFSIILFLHCARDFKHRP